MRLIKTAIKTGIAAKLFQEARKPQNQEKLRQVWKQMNQKKAQARTSR